MQFTVYVEHKNQTVGPGIVTEPPGIVDIIEGIKTQIQSNPTPGIGTYEDGYWLVRVTPVP